jgi:hypothetical protein
MFTQAAEWHEFLYSCGLTGRLWLRVDRVGVAYVHWRAGIATAPFDPSPWHDEVQKMIDAFAADPEGAEQKLAEFLAEPDYDAQGANSVVSEENRGKIIKMLHVVVEKPNPDEWVS